MKKILFLLIFASLSFSQTRTSVWQLPQFTTGDTLRAGTKNSTVLSNFSLNNGFARIDSIGGVQIDSSGLFRSLYGRGSGNLTIDAGTATATPQRIVLNDSLYGTYNWQTTGSLLVGGNVTVGGYMTLDSVYGNFLVRGGNIDLRYDGDPATGSIYINSLEDSVYIHGTVRIPTLSSSSVNITGGKITADTLTSNYYVKHAGQSRVTSDNGISGTTLGNVSGLSVNVKSGNTYHFVATLFTTSNVAGGVKVAIAGTATATSVIYEGMTYSGGTITQSRATSLGTAVGAVTAVTAAKVTIEGTISVSASGTLTVQIAENASAGTALVLTGSTFIVNQF